MGNTGTPDSRSLQAVALGARASHAGGTSQDAATHSAEHNLLVQTCAPLTKPYADDLEVKLGAEEDVKFAHLAGKSILHNNLTPGELLWVDSYKKRKLQLHAQQKQEAHQAARALSKSVSNAGVGGPKPVQKSVSVLTFYIDADGNGVVRDTTYPMFHCNDETEGSLATAITQTLVFVAEGHGESSPHVQLQPETVTLLGCSDKIPQVTVIFDGGAAVWHSMPLAKLVVCKTYCLCHRDNKSKAIVWLKEQGCAKGWSCRWIHPVDL